MGMVVVVVAERWWWWEAAVVVVDGGGGRIMNDVSWQSVVMRLCTLSYTAAGMVCRVL
jgi:hypothetical protein